MKLSRTLRRITTVILVLSLLLPLLASCGNGEAGESSLSAESSAESNAPADNTPSARMTEIDAIVSQSVDRTQASSNLLKGKSYTVSREVSPDYPDVGNVLTDGLAPIGFLSGIWAGFNSQSYESLEIKVDLGKEYSGIADFSTCVLHYAPYGIYVPTSVTVIVAGENGEAVEVGTAYTPGDISNESYKLDIKLQGTVTARYITFRYDRPLSTWLFVGEIEAYAYGEEYAAAESVTFGAEDFYAYKGLPEADGAVWSDTEVDYGKTTTIAPQKVYVYAHEDIPSEYASDWYNTRNLAILYDGKSAATAELSDAGWFHITRAGGRDIIYDLGKITAVTGFKVGFLKQVLAGVNAPVTVGMEVSADGTNWQTVYAEWMIDSAGNATTVYLDEEPTSAFRARFVKFTFTLTSHIYIDEITVFGNKNAEGAAEPDPAQSLTFETQDYITAEDFDGVDNILLSYNGQVTESYGHDEAGLITVEEYLPYVAYLDKEGNIVDTFFDGFLYLPYGAFNRDNFIYTAEGWNHYIDDIYYPDRNMNALNECVGNVGDALSIADYKVKVYTAVLRPYGEYQYGDIDGDGVDEDFTKIEDRKKAVKWMMDEELRRFNEGNYAHLEFHGFYWFDEEIYYDDPFEIEVVKYAVDYAHSLGVKMIWIPFNGGKGTYDWESFGFDLVCRQPNYMFGRTFDNSFLYDTAEMAQQYGMCVEMEISDINKFNDLWRFYEYMRVGAETGYMNAVKIYYQEGVPGPVYDAYHSDDPTMRQLYDDIYSYAMCEYSEKSEAELTLPEYTGETVVKSGRSKQVDFDLSDELYNNFLTVGVAPRYGAVKIDRSGKITYYANKDFVGEDTFAVRLSVGNNVGPLCYITVKVESMKSN